MRSPPKPLAIILLACLIAFASVLTIASCRKKPAKVHTGGEIHGSIVAMIKPRGDHAAAAGMPAHGMKLPELTLGVVDEAGTVVATELTDLQDRFVFSTQKPAPTASAGTSAASSPAPATGSRCAATRSS